MKYTLILLFIQISCLVGYSQSQIVTRADIAQEKKMFITEELKLSDSEANAFWSLYESYEHELKLLNNKQRKIKKVLKNDEVLSEAEQYKLTKQYLILERKKADVKLKYLESFSSKIGKKKAVAVFKAEDDFKRELFKKLKRLPPPPPPPSTD